MGMLSMRSLDLKQMKHTIFEPQFLLGRVSSRSPKMTKTEVGQSQRILVKALSGAIGAGVSATVLYPFE